MTEEQLRYYILVEGAEKGAAQFKLVGDAAKQAAAAVNQTSGAAGNGSSQIKKFGDATERAGAQTERASRAQRGYFAHIARTTIQSAAINKAFLSMVNSMGRAVKQADLIENFPATMAALGISASEASDGFQKLREYVQSVGGDLTAAASSVSRFAAVNKNVQASVAMYAGINNALIAGGSAAETQAAALEQLTQGYARGRIEGEEWRSMQTSMNLAMTETARALNMPSTEHLRVALTEGKISMNEFMATMARVSTGTGPVAQAAMAQMQGIGFAAAVMSNTLTNGLTAIYQAVGRQNIIAFLTLLTDVIAVLASWVVVAINAFISLFNLISGFFGGPQISNLAKDTGAMAGNLAAGASAAGDMGDGLDDAGKSAKKLNKQLASFDKMNVLAEKDSGSGGKDKGGGAGGGGPFNAGQLGDLGNIFDGISNGFKEASHWAKIIAGIIAGIIGVKFAQGIIDQVDGIVTSFGKAGRAIGTFKNTLKNFPSKALDKLKDAPIVIGGNFDKAKASFMGAGRFMLNPWVLAAATIATVVGGLVWLYNENEEFKKGFDKVWKPIIDTLKVAYNVIVEYLGYAIGWMIDEWKKLQPVLQPVLDMFGSFIDWAKGLLEQIGITGSGLEMFGKVIGTIGAIIAIAVLAPIALLVAAIAAIGLGFIATVGFVAWFVKAAGDFIAEFVWSVKTFFENLWKNIVDVFKAAPEWFQTKFKEASDAIASAWSTVVEFFQGIWDGIVNIYTNIKDWFKTKFDEAWSAVKSVWEAAPRFFQEKWDAIKQKFADIKSWFKAKFEETWGAITEVFKDPGGWFRVNVVDKIVDAFNGIKDRIGAFFSGVWNGIGQNLKDTINNLLRLPLRIPSVEIAGKTIGGQTLIPRLARGGILSQATTAIIGEAGEEAVIPLENNTQGLDKIAKLLTERMGSGQPTQIVIQIGEERIATRMIDLINEKTNLSGRNAIYV